MVVGASLDGVPDDRMQGREDDGVDWWMVWLCGGACGAKGNLQWRIPSLQVEFADDRQEDHMVQLWLSRDEVDLVVKGLRIS